MTAREENEILTHVGPGTPAGELLRRYWQPAALAEELPIGGAPLPVRLLGEDLVLFRNDQGQPGLLGLHCSHRGADLSYGRLEDGGLRCIYHGWLYDAEGRCLEQPGEPAGSTFCEKIRHPAYPCQEAGGIIFAYLGPGEPPLLPAYEFFSTPEEHRLADKFLVNCNYLQGNEGNLDPAHLSFLHRRFGQGRGPGAPAPSNEAERSAERPREPTAEDAHLQRTVTESNDYSTDRLYRLDYRPTIEVEETDYGVRISAARMVGPNERFLRVTHFIFPNLGAVATGQGSGEGYTINWMVPLDDTHHWNYMLEFNRVRPFNKERHPSGHDEEMTPDYQLRRHQANRYLQDRASMATECYSGMSYSFSAQDACVIEGAGPIQDRTEEHLGYTDQAIVLGRKLMFQAIEDVQAGRDPRHVVREPDANCFPHLEVVSDVIPASADWRAYGRERMLNR